ncbi:MAG: phospho-sugar mutase, partial [Leucobacter sp.]|nr:phospho-sugar mutase [Leucobacter sp.]
EEPGALDLAYALAEECGAPYVLANDPDADRLALAARHPASPNGYRQLNGNELGLLLGQRAAEQELLTAAREQRKPTGALASTLVSSPALGALARHYGLAHAETLPGFKWVARVPGLIFGYEESIGYLTTPAVVGDKDGVSAAAEALAMLRDLHAAGRTVWQELDALSERIGLYASAQIVVRRERMAEAETLAERIRAHPPTGFGGIAVTRARDFRSPGLAPAPTNLLAYDLADGSRVMIRPSGTEPKLKIYLDAFSEAGSVAERRAQTSAALAAIEAAARDYLTGAEQ